MAELVDAYDSKSYGAIHGSSILPPGTNENNLYDKSREKFVEYCCKILMKKTKVIVILGPTASGKSDLAVRIAREINGEVISADSRQVYKGLNIGTGKITVEEMHGIKHHLLDVAEPNQRFTSADFKRLAEKSISEIVNKGKIPILCGGTGFYIDVLLDRIQLPEISENTKLREELKDRSVDELFIKLRELNPERANSMNDSDRKNARRLIRAIEICSSDKNSQILKKVESKYDPYFIGINPKKEILHERIHRRLINRLENGMIDEAKTLHENGLSYERMEELGLEYRYMARYLQGKLSYEQMVEQLENEIRHYAKRQMTWFRRNKDIVWYESAEARPLIGPTFLRTDLK